MRDFAFYAKSAPTLKVNELYISVLILALLLGLLFFQARRVQMKTRTSLTLLIKFEVTNHHLPVASEIKEVDASQPQQGLHLFQASDGQNILYVKLQKDTVWLTLRSPISVTLRSKICPLNEASPRAANHSSLAHQCQSSRYNSPEAEASRRRRCFLR